MTAPIEEFVVSIGTKFDQAGFDRVMKGVGQNVNTLAQRLNQSGGHGAIGSKISGAAHTLSGRVPGGSTIAAGISAAAEAGPIGAIFGGIALGALAVAAAATTMAAGVAKAFEQLNFQANVAGGSASSLAMLKTGFENVGLAAEGAVKIAENLGLALKYNPGTASLLAHLGVQVARDKNGLVDLTKTIDNLMDKLVSMSPITAAAYGQMFGISPADIENWRRFGKEIEAAQARYAEKAKAMGVDFDDLATKSHAFMDAWRNDWSTLDLAVDKVAETSLPFLTKALVGIGDGAAAATKAVVRFFKEGDDNFEIFIAGLDRVAQWVVFLEKPFVDFFDRLQSKLLAFDKAFEATAFYKYLIGPAAALGNKLGNLIGPAAALGNKLGTWLTTPGSLFATIGHGLQALPAPPGATAPWPPLPANALPHALPHDSATAPTRDLATGGLFTPSGALPEAPLAPASGNQFQPVEGAYHLPAGLLDKVYSTESSRGRNLVSPAGAQGPFQFTPQTWGDYGQGSNPFNLQDSANAAAHYIADLTKQFGGSVAKALAAYNWGPWRLQQDIDAHGDAWRQFLPDETRDYLHRILGNNTALLSTAGAQQHAANTITNNQTNNVSIRVDGAADPHATAVAVADQQRRVNANLSRHFSGAILA